MSNDGWFWAGVSGKRAENIQQLQNNISQWREHVADLEQEIADLKGQVQHLSYARKQWFQIAVDESTKADIRAEILARSTGKRPLDFMSEKEYERCLQYKRKFTVQHFVNKWKKNKWL